ncbi:MAG: hypothetical protein O2960_23300 [Verrucomicrobia bacterium]|nr:hypothetical protein [Verrucomicrobiota bacterium]
MTRLITVKTIVTVCGVLACTALCFGETNVNETRSRAWSANTGWIQWRPDRVYGARIDEYVCSGFIYSANLGWINLGSGQPRNGIHYQNNSATDFGVNLDSNGNLRGSAYGANIGWIRFEDFGSPRIDLDTGGLRGLAYGANIGWINLGEFNTSLSIDYIAPGIDSDSDAIPDAWELEHAGNLETLGIQTDSDFDGQTDLEEYLSDTDPLDKTQNFRILEFTSRNDAGSVVLTWISRPTRAYTVEAIGSFGSPEKWVNVTREALVGEDGTMTLALKQGEASEQAYFRVKTSRRLPHP